MRLPQLPMIAHTGSKRVAMGLGGTLVPTFELVRYVDRPPCLPADDDGAGAPAPSTPAGKPVTRPAAPSYRLPAKPERQAPLVDDEIPFAPCWQ